MKTPTIFFGASQFVLPIIEMLQREYDLKLVVTTEQNPTDAVPAYCKKNNIPYIAIKNFKDPEWQIWKLKIKNWKLDFAVLAYFGLIVPQSLIDIFPKGIINIHPSRLPQYRGPTPVQTAVLLGDVRTGVSIMLLDRAVDHGPILAQETEEIYATDTAVSLYERLFPKGAALLEKVLPDYISGKKKPVEQNHDKATFTKPLTRESGFIDPTKPTSPELLDRMIRAYFPWPGAWTKFTFQRANPRHLYEPGSQEPWPELVSGSQKIVKFLPGKMLQVEGKKPMSYKDFINGYPEGKEWLSKLHIL